MPEPVCNRVLVLHGKIESCHVYWAFFLLAGVSVCVCICVSVYQQEFCPLASVESFGDIAMIFSEQIGSVALTNRYSGSNK